jgi:hypothetical protein
VYARLGGDRWEAPQTHLRIIAGHESLRLRARHQLSSLNSGPHVTPPLQSSLRCVLRSELWLYGRIEPFNRSGARQFVNTRRAYRDGLMGCGASTTGSKGPQPDTTESRHSSGQVAESTATGEGVSGETEAAKASFNPALPQDAVEQSTALKATVPEPRADTSETELHSSAAPVSAQEQQQPGSAAQNSRERGPNPVENLQLDQDDGCPVSEPSTPNVQMIHDGGERGSNARAAPLAQGTARGDAAVGNSSEDSESDTDAQQTQRQRRAAANRPQRAMSRSSYTLRQRHGQRQKPGHLRMRRVEGREGGQSGDLELILQQPDRRSLRNPNDASSRQQQQQQEVSLVVKQDETMQSVKRRMSVSMGVSEAQMAILLGISADGADDNTIAADIAIAAGIIEEEE